MKKLLFLIVLGLFILAGLAACDNECDGLKSLCNQCESAELESMCQLQAEILIQLDDQDACSDFRSNFDCSIILQSQ